MKNDHVTKKYLRGEFQSFEKRLDKSLDQKFEKFAHKYIMPIYSILDPMQKDVSVLKSDVKVLKKDFCILKKDVRVLKADMKVVKSDISDIKIDISDLKKDMRGVKAIGRKQDRRLTAVEDFARVSS